MDETEQRFRVLADMEVSYPNPIGFSAGEEVTVGRRDEVWTDWVWVTTATGNSGWAPVAYLESTGENRARALCDYTARELSSRKGEVLIGLNELGGWHWCRNAAGEEGWAPAFNLRPVD